MAILVNEDTRLLVQGMTGREGSFHTSHMRAYGTNVVAGVTPGKGGTEMDGIPVFNTVSDAVAATGANATVIFVPGSFGADPIMNAAEAGIPLIVSITEHIPVQDEVKVYRFVEDQGSRLIGPNCPGLVSSGRCKVGIMPNQLFMEGHVGVVSRSGTLTYEMVNELTQRRVGQSTTVGIGGDPVIGTSFTDILRLFDEDDDTHVIVLIGEIGGTDEEEAAAYIGSRSGKPVVAFISGRTAPPGKRMGHAGAIITGGIGGPQHKVEAFEAVGVPVADSIADIADKVEALLGTAALP